MIERKIDGLTLTNTRDVEKLVNNLKDGELVHLDKWNWVKFEDGKYLYSHYASDGGIYDKKANINNERAKTNLINSIFNTFEYERKAKQTKDTNKTKNEKSFKKEKDNSINKKESSNKKYSKSERLDYWNRILKNPKSDKQKKYALTRIEKLKSPKKQYTIEEKYNYYSNISKNPVSDKQKKWADYKLNKLNSKKNDINPSWLNSFEKEHGLGKYNKRNRKLVF